jgi:cell division transport system permease protein
MLKRIFINTFRNIRRAPYQALAAILVLTLTFLVTDVFVLVLLGSQKVMNYFETRPQVTAFFTDQVSENAILGLKQQLENQDYVANVTYISKQKALEIYREQNKDDPLLLEMVTADILPASLEVSAKAVGNLPKIKNDLTGVTGVEEVVYQQDIVEALTKWTRGIWVAGIFLVSVLMFTSLLVLTLIISMKVSAKRQEISTIRLLGAAPWFINGPYLLEGAFYGVVGSVVAWGIMYILLLYATPLLVSFLKDMNVLPVNPLFMLLLLTIMSLIAAGLGMISGTLSSGRYGNKER